jgi:hypothetical protein
MMTGSDMRAMQKQLGFSCEELSEALRVTEGHVRAMLAGSKPITPVNEKALHGLAAYVRSMRGVAR